MATRKTSTTTRTEESDDDEPECDDDSDDDELEEEHRRAKATPPATRIAGPRKRLKPRRGILTARSRPLARLHRPPRNA